MRTGRIDAARPVFFMGVLACASILSACAGSGHTPAVEKYLAPDTVLLNGRIITVDPQDRIAEAVAIKDGKIIAVDSSSAIRELTGRSTRVIDLQGLTATPGLIDSHCHVSGGLTRLYMLDLDYPRVAKIADMVNLVKAKVGELKAGEWVMGKGWDEGKLAERRYVYAADIDPVTPDNPGWFEPTMGHYGTANSYALKLAKITRNTPDPPGGTIDRYPDGTPTGLLKESAMNLVGRVIPDYTPEQVEKGLLHTLDNFIREGMTAVKDPGIGSDIWKHYQEILAKDELKVRVFVLWRAGNTLESTTDLIRRIAPFTKPQLSTGSGRLVSGGVKLFVDGSGGARTAWVYDEWNKNFTEVDRGNHGYSVVDPDLYRRQVAMLHKAGLHISTHAIGDRAIDLAVDSYAEALRENAIPGLRHGIIHCNIPSDHALQLMSELQKKYDAGYPELQAPFMWWIGDTYAGNFGPQRCLRFMPFKKFMDSGMQWGGGSDFPVTPLEARYGIWATMARESMQGTYGSHPYGKEQAGEVRAALRSYTIWNARLLFMEDTIGSIERGKFADIAVWNKDPYTASAEEIKNMQCQMTLLGGKIVYQNPQTAVTVTEGSGSL